MRIGLAISGGGYRATTYSLGTFSYLNHIQLRGKPLLKHVVALSTVSGGSITGITYAKYAKTEGKFEDYQKNIYKFITEFDLVEDGIYNFVNPTSKRSLI